MNEEHRCEKKCGKCCIVCTEVALTREEVRSGSYRMQYYHDKYRAEVYKEGWSDRGIYRKEKFVPVLGYNLPVCIYFDPVKLECMIYESRPYICRVFDCHQDDETRKQIFSGWKRLNNGG